MAEQNIGLRITLLGKEQIIKSITDLDKAIKDAKKSLRFDDPSFEKYSKQIASAETQLKKFKQAQSSIQPNKNLEQFVRFGSLVTQGFAAATTALDLFGVESERVGEAATRAQQLLTLAVTARGIAEEITALKTNTNTTATIANTTATTAATTATRGFFAVLAANPFGAIIAAAGLLITALTFLANRTDEATEAQKKFNEELNKQAGDEIGRFRVLTQTINDTSLSLATRKKALEDLKKQFPAYFKDLNDEKILTGEITLATQDLEKAILSRAKARALEQRIQQNTGELFTIEQDLNVLYKERAKALEAGKFEWADILTIVTGNIAGIAKIGKEQGDVLGIITKINELEDREAKLNDENAAALAEIKSINQQNDAITGDIVDNTDAINAALEKQKNALLAQIALRGELLKLQIDLLNTTQKLEDIEFGDEAKNAKSEYEALTKEVNAYKKVLQDYYDLVGANLPQTEREIKNAEQLLAAIKGNTEVLRTLDIPQAQIVAQKIDLISTALKNYKISITPDEIRNVVSAFNDIEEGDALTFDEVIKRRQDLFKLEQNFIKQFVEERLKGTKLTGEFLKEEQKNAAEAGKKLFDVVVAQATAIDNFTRSTEDALDGLKKLREEVEKLAADPAALTGFVAKNRQALTEQFTFNLGDIQENRDRLLKLDEEITSKRFDIQGEFYTDVQFLEYQLAQQGIDISKISYEEKLKLLQAFIQKQQAIELDDEAKRKKRVQDRVNDLKSALQNLQSVLTSISQISEQYYSAQLDRLAKQNEDIQSKIVGTTKEANDKRLEADQIYQEKRKELEKRAAKAALQISLAQATANAAAAIIKVTEQTGVLAPIAAGIIAAINVAQIGIIANQLSQIDSYQRGGFIKGQGGMVVGPPHEAGGVKYAQGGIELEGGEAVINRVSSLRYADMLSSMNMAGGGKPLVVNNFDDSRIVEAIAKQRKEPLQAYVLEQDITNKQAISKKLSQLAQI